MTLFEICYFEMKFINREKALSNRGSWLPIVRNIRKAVTNKASWLP
jgi:hypothetical protein